MFGVDHIKKLLSIVIYWEKDLSPRDDDIIYVEPLRAKIWCWDNAKALGKSD